MSEVQQKVEKEKSKRILTFDIMRGYFLVVIFLNHLQYYPNGMSWLTGRSMLYVSTAEGFFLVSGIVLGIVRGRKLLNQPFRVAAKILWKRSLQLYATSIILTLLFTLIGQLFIGNPGLKYGIYTGWDTWWELILHTLNLSYTYGWADFLRLYAIFIFFAPFALWLLRNGKVHILLAISIASWALYPYLPDNPIIAQPFSWQFIFFSGFIIGYYWEPIVTLWRTLSLRSRKIIGTTFASTFLATAVVNYLLVFNFEISGPLAEPLRATHNELGRYFEKDRLEFWRILLGTVWFWGFFSLIHRYEEKILKYFGSFLITLGTNSLYVYTISAFVVFLIHLAVPPHVNKNVILNFVLSVAAFSLVWIALKTKFLMKIIPR